MEELIGKWTYSLDGEDFRVAFDTKEEAICEAIKDAKFFEKTRIYVGQIEKYNPYIHTSDIFEQLGEEAYNECGEYAEDYLCNVSKEACEELEEKINKVFDEWSKKHNQEPTFYKVSDIQEIEI